MAKILSKCCIESLSTLIPCMNSLYYMFYEIVIRIFSSFKTQPYISKYEIGVKYAIRISFFLS